MLIKDTSAKAIIPLIGAEYTTHFFFTQVAFWANKEGYKKVARIMLKEAQEEIGHTQVLEQYLMDMQCEVELPSLDTSKQEFTSLIDVINKGLALMVVVRDMYEKVSLEVFDEDVTTFNFLQKFITIQQQAIAYWADLSDIAKDLEPTKFNQLYLQKFFK